MQYTPPAGPPPGWEPEPRQSFTQANYSEPGTSGIELPELTDDDAKALFHTPAPPRATVHPLTAPVCLPQISSGIEAPFARGWNPQMRASGVEEADWFRFIDGLNVAFTASPPLRVANLAGLVIGFVPYHWAIIAGVVIQTSAQTAAHVLSKTLSDRYLRHANEEFFKPRGLAVRLCRTDATRHLVGLGPKPSDNKTLAVAKGIGRTAEGIGLRLPVVRKFIARIHPAPPVDERTGGDATARRVAKLEGRAMPMEYYNVPPVHQDGVYDKTSELAGKLEKWMAHRKQSKQSRARQLLAIREGGVDYSGLTAQGGKTGRKAARAQRRADRALRHGRIPHASAALRAKVRVADAQEANASGGILWIVLLNQEQDAQIEGRELVDSKDNHEVIPVSEWEDELDFEESEDEHLLEEHEQSGKHQLTASGSGGPSQA